MADWIKVCAENDLQPNSGVCALVAGKQIAIFYLVKDKAVYAIDNYDPIGKANVLSRGLIGDVKGQLVVASPLYKQHFNLQTGACLEDETVQVRAYPARLLAGNVEIQIPAELTVESSNKEGAAA